MLREDTLPVNFLKHQLPLPLGSLPAKTHCRTGSNVSHQSKDALSLARAGAFRSVSAAACSARSAETRKSSRPSKSGQTQKSLCRKGIPVGCCLIKKFLAADDESLVVAGGEKKSASFGVFESIAAMPRPTPGHDLPTLLHLCTRKVSSRPPDSAA